MMMYEQRRENFNKILEAYLDYLSLYRLFNRGHIKGATPFYVFYWRMTFPGGDGEVTGRRV